MKQLFALLIVLIVVMTFFISKRQHQVQTLGVGNQSYVWDVTAIDTMKYSRDVARQFANDSSFDQTIEKQVSDIAKTGATHVAIGTPYNEEFVPFMDRWVKAIRRHNMNVWFRGNVAGWESWFEYPRIGRAEHTRQVLAFIKNNPQLFSDGDIFSSCPECENGGTGDPRMTGDTADYRMFLIDEYRQVKETFEIIGVDVPSNYYSMNGDVAKLIMDKNTTQSLDGLVVIDHYVKTPEKLIADIDALAKQSGGKVVLGEWGAPIPDIHGSMTEKQQARWIDQALAKLYKNKNVVGLNYWTGYGSSTALWNNDGSPREAVSVLTKYYTPISKAGIVVNELNDVLSDVQISSDRISTTSLLNGTFIIPPAPAETIVTIQKEGYEYISMPLSEVSNRIVLKNTDEDFIFKLRKTLQTFTP